MTHNWRCACDDCGDTGKVFTHAETCDDELCALNADWHSCCGQVLPCACRCQEEDTSRWRRPLSLA